jgi:hypothetical protein
MDDARAHRDAGLRRERVLADEPGDECLEFVEPPGPDGVDEGRSDAVRGLVRDRRVQLDKAHAEEVGILDRAGGRTLQGEDPGGPTGLGVRVVDPDHDLLVDGRDDPNAILAGAADGQICLVRVLGPGHARRLRQAGCSPDARARDPGPARDDIVAVQLDRLEGLAPAR